MGNNRVLLKLRFIMVKSSPPRNLGGLTCIGNQVIYLSGYELIEKYFSKGKEMISVSRKAL